MIHRSFTKLIIGIALGVIPTFWFLQKSPHFNRVAFQKVINLVEEATNTKIVFKNTSLNLLTGTLNFGSVIIKSNRSKNLIFTCKNGKLTAFKNGKFSLKTLGIHLSVNNSEVHINSVLKNKNEILLALKDIFSATKPHPLKPHFITIRNTKIYNHEPTKKPIILELPGKILFYKDQNTCWHGAFDVRRGSISKDDPSIHRTLITNIRGKIKFHEYDFNQGLLVKTKLTAQAPALSDSKCFFNGMWSTAKTNFKLYNKTKKLDVVLKHTTRENLKITGRVPLEITNSSLKNKIEFDKDDVCLLEYADKLLNINFDCKNQLSSITGSHEWSCLKITNKQKITFAPFFIKPNDLFISAPIAQNSNGTYKIGITHANTNKTKYFAGSFFFEQEKKLLKISGKSPYGSYNALFDFARTVPLIKLLLTKNGQHLISFNSNKNKASGFIHYSFLHTLLLQHINNFIFDQKGEIHFLLNFHDLKNITGKVFSKNGIMYITKNQNVIKKFSMNFEYDVENKHVTLENTNVRFQKGNILCKHAELLFKRYLPTYIYAPIQIKDFLLSMPDYFLGIIDGNILIEKKEQTKKVFASGNIVLKKGILKENIFSSNTKQSYSSYLLPEDYNIECNINISNEEPLRAQTAFLEAKTNIDLKTHILYKKHTPFLPQLVGTVDIESGTLNFLRNKLFITLGKINFLPNRINDPFINLIAKNKIKKYIVTLQATGTAQNPTIILESNPELTEEQILGLLLAGSENTTLQSDLPTIVMQNLNNLITGSKKTIPTTTNFFKQITKPLKYIQITPNFTDQSGRGGIKGSIQIDVSDRLHARIQKNLSSQEDFSFQVEYFLTDDINVKAIKDQRGDLGAEVEFCFKP
jgi:hypothetical protein